MPLHQIFNDSGQPQGIAPTSEYFRQCRGNPLWLPCVGAILYGCPDFLKLSYSQPFMRLQTQSPLRMF
ncbi:MAG: hypothetical protein KAI83_00975 [Thiomargarita sp.]|nr:hypothetical protein [Thiomargarita sp.]